MELGRPHTLGPSPGSEKKGKGMKELEKEQIEFQRQLYYFSIIVIKGCNTHVSTDGFS